MGVFVISKLGSGAVQISRSYYRRYKNVHTEGKRSMTNVKGDFSQNTMCIVYKSPWDTKASSR